MIHCIIFSEKRETPSQCYLRLNVQTIPTPKLQGFSFNRNWSKQKQTPDKYNESTKSPKSDRIYKLGPDCKMLEIRYESLVRIKVNYGLIIYNNAKLKILKKIYVIQNTALRLTIGAFHTSLISSFT